MGKVSSRWGKGGERQRVKAPKRPEPGECRKEARVHRGQDRAWGNLLSSARIRAHCSKDLRKMEGSKAGGLGKDRRRTGAGVGQRRKKTRWQRTRWALYA
jgi:hypothetical protein